MCARERERERETACLCMREGGRQTIQKLSKTMKVKPRHIVEKNLHLVLPKKTEFFASKRNLARIGKHHEQWDSNSLPSELRITS